MDGSFRQGAYLSILQKQVSEKQPRLSPGNLRRQQLLALDHFFNQSIRKLDCFWERVGTEEHFSFVIGKGKARLSIGVGGFLLGLVGPLPCDRDEVDPAVRLGFVQRKVQETCGRDKLCSIVAGDLYPQK